MKADTRLAPLGLEHPENRGVLAHLARGPRAGTPIARPASVPDPYQGAGAHPDVVEWLWQGLGRNLPRASRALVHGTPALVHARAGIVLALALGTSYALRVPPGRLAEAERCGLTVVHLFRSAGVTLDLAELGPAWRFGAWQLAEREWLDEEAARLE